MKALIVGCGLVGKGLAAHLRQRGHSVVGTTTREARVEELRAVCDEVHVLVGSDRAALARAAEGCPKTKLPSDAIRAPPHLGIAHDTQQSLCGAHRWTSLMTTAQDISSIAASATRPSRLLSRRFPS